MMALARPQRRARPLQVKLVSDNPETLKGLATYLTRAGVTTSITRRIDELTNVTATALSAVVLFPDDFDAGCVLRAVATLLARRPEIMLIVVTKDPRRFAVQSSAEDVTAPIVLPKPVWGWTILDAIRAQASAETTQPRRLRDRQP